MHGHFNLSAGPLSPIGSFSVISGGPPALPQSPRHQITPFFLGKTIPYPVHSQRGLPVVVHTPDRALEPGRKNLSTGSSASSNALKNGLRSSKVQASQLPTHVVWYNKNKELWVEVGSEQELYETMQSETEKFIVLDLYAGWCSSCKAAYPALCKVAGNPEFQKDFKFVKADVQNKEIASFVRGLGVKGIPTVVVFAPGGKQLAHFGASFKKMNLVKANLTVIGANKGAEFATDSDGYVFPRP